MTDNTTPPPVGKGHALTEGQRRVLELLATKYAFAVRSLPLDEYRVMYYDQGDLKMVTVGDDEFRPLFPYLDEVSFFHFIPPTWRYSITPAGRAALGAGEGEVSK